MPLTRIHKPSPQPPEEENRERVIRIRTEKDFDKIIEARDETVVIIESGVRCIPDYALSEMDALVQVVIPDTVESIENYAFANCMNLRELTIPDSVRYIGEGAFESCGALEQIVLPYGLTEIPAAAFAYCTLLKEVWLPPTVKLIDDEAFLECCSLEKIHGGEGLRYVNCNAFFHCSVLKELTLPESVSSVGVQGFEDGWYQPPVTLFSADSPCTEIEDSVTIPDGVRAILAGSLYREPKLNRVILPDSVRNISRHAFDSTDIIQADEDEVHGLAMKRFPVSMNLPKGYLRQETQFDAKLALAFCETIWKDEVSASDFECIILYQNDPLARYLAAQKLSVTPWHNIKSMMARPRRSVKHLEHLTEYFCMHYPSLCYPSNDAETIREQLYREAVERGADGALRLLHRWCRPFGGGDATLTEQMLYRTMSPYEADFLLEYNSTHRMGPKAFIGENELAWADSDRPVPAEYLRCLAALWAKPDILQIMEPYADPRTYAKALPFVENAADALDRRSLVRTLSRNSVKSDIMLELLCHFFSADELEKLYNDYMVRRFDELYVRRYHLNRLARAMRFNGSFAADLLIARLDEEIGEAERSERERSFRSPVSRLNLHHDPDDANNSDALSWNERLFGKRAEVRRNRQDDPFGESSPSADAAYEDFGEDFGEDFDEDFDEDDGWGDLFDDPSLSADFDEKYDDFFGEHDEDDYIDYPEDTEENLEDTDGFEECDEARAYAESASDFEDEYEEEYEDEAEGYAASADDDIDEYDADEYDEVEYDDSDEE